MASRNIPDVEKQSPINRAQEIQRTSKEFVDDGSFTLLNLDQSILWTIRNVVNPQVIDNGEKINVPVIWATAERYNSMKNEGYLRDARGKIMVPLILVSRINMAPYETLTPNKEVKNIQTLHYQKYSPRNKYSKFSVQQGLQPTKELYHITMPDYMTVQFEITIWCEYLEQVNHLTETFVFHDGKYWGDPSTNKNPYVKGVTYDFAQEISTDSDRLVRTTVTLETLAELLPKYATNKPNIDKSYSIENVKVSFKENDGDIKL